MRSTPWKHLGALAVVLLVAPCAAAAGGPPPLDLPIWSVIPFVVLLLCIAVLPLVVEHWWHRNRNKALVAFLAALPVLIYLAVIHFTTPQPALVPLGHEMFKYVSFIILLGSLFVVAGGIVFRGDIEGRPATNTMFLAGGAVLANLIGTTGASVLLIRPAVRINRQRQHTRHLPVFFIFVVGNVGGLLTPLGDPPLFLGFLSGVPFAWTLTLWREWLLVNGLVLAVFFVWDTLAHRRESSAALQADREQLSPLRLEGLRNLPLLAGVVAGVLLQGWIPGERGELIGAGVMAGMAIVSLLITPAALREANGFTWHPIVEVAVLFAGIFAAMVPALELLKARGAEFGITKAWEYFWLTGGLSGFLDNAPTYLAFATMAAGPNTIGDLVKLNPKLLQAISCGAVFFGAMTYIGNGPNFMVKAIAEKAGYRTPSFFGYLAYSALVLLPVFAIVTLVFFRPG